MKELCKLNMTDMKDQKPLGNPQNLFQREVYIAFIAQNATISYGQLFRIKSEVSLQEDLNVMSYYDLVQNISWP